MDAVGDYLLAATGVRRVLAKKHRRITVADQERAEMLPREIRRGLTRFATDTGGPKKAPHMGPFDFDWVQEHLAEALAGGDEAEPLSPALLEDLADAFRPEDHDEAASYLGAVRRVLPYLQSIMPTRSTPSVAGAQTYDPSDTEIARFRRAFDVADDPMVVVRDLEAGILVDDQLQHLRALYPTIGGTDADPGTLKRTLGFVLARAITDKKSFKLPYRKELQAQLVYGTDTLPAGLAADLQANFADKGTQPPTAPSPSRATGKTATMFQSQTAATAEGDLRK